MLKLPRINILIRKTEKWDEITPTQHIAMLENSADRHYVNIEKYLGNIKKWNEYYSSPYVDYRQKLKDLSFESFKKTGLNIEIALDETEHINKPYLPTDDDDWYHPDIGQVSDYFSNPRIKLVYWKAWVFHLSKNSTYDGNTFSIFTEQHGRWMASNGYAIRSPDWGFYRVHNRNKLHLYEPDEVVYIDKPLSVWVQHPASIWELQSFDKPNVNLTKKQPIPDELEWAARYIETSYEFTYAASLIPNT
jgi:hypothetical protein